jgi:glycosyltransferase involved in cell wall biosynthesis
MINSYISVIIPTYRDWDRLRLCVEALLDQSLSRDLFEIIIVNNDSSDPYPSWFQEKNLLLLEESIPGSYSARNKGISFAKGDILAFTDSDCIPEKNWLQNAYSKFQDASIHRIAGKVEIFFKDKENKTFAELFEHAYAFNQKRNVEVLKGCVTANFLSRKSLFDSVGVFDNSKKSGEDFGWNRRANSKGFNLVYADNVIVKHPARREITALMLKRRRVFGGKKVFKINSVKDLIKELFYLPYLFLTTLIMPWGALFFKRKGYSFFDKLKIAVVHFCLFSAVTYEYFRLLFGGKTLRK